MPALSKIVTSITQERYVPAVVDNVLKNNVLTTMLMKSNVRPWNGGRSINLPVNLLSYTNLGSYSGFDRFSVDQQNTRDTLQFTPSQEYCSITLSGIQLAVNKGDMAVVDLAATEFEQRGNDLKNEFAAQIYGDGTGNSSKDLVGLEAIVDDGTTAGTYGSLSRTTYPNLNATRTAQSGSISLANLASDISAVVQNQANPNKMVIVTTPAVFDILEALFTPTTVTQFTPTDFRMTENGIVKVGGTVAANQGFRAMTYRGIPIVADPQCTSGNIYTLSLDHLYLYHIPQPGRQVKAGWAWTGWKEPVDQDVVSGQLLWYGQLCCDAPRTNARRTGVTS